MPSKLTFHIMGFDNQMLDLIQEMHPSCVKILDSPDDMKVDRIRQIASGTLIIQRVSNDLDKDYTRAADDFFNSPTFQDAFNKLKGRGVIFEGLNEPIIATASDAQKLVTWYQRFAQLVHGGNEKCAAFSFSTGNPDLSLVPLLADAARACDYIALHEYLDPKTNGSGLQHYRDFISQLPADARKPILITECGADDGNNQGWLTYYTADQYMQLLQTYDVELMKDAYVVGATVFQYGAGGNWAKFDLRSIAKRLADYVANAGGGAFPLPTMVSLPTQPSHPSQPGTSGTTPQPPTQPTQPSGTSGTTPQPPTQPGSVGVTLTPQIYVIQFGDNLSTIAKKFGVTVQAILDATNAQAATDATFKAIPNASLIRPGQKLIIPATASMPSLSSTPSTSSTPTSSTPSTPSSSATPSASSSSTSTPATSSTTASPSTPALSVTPAGALSLRDYPRPANDNGFGIHWGLDSRTDQIAKYIPTATDMKLKWTLFYPENADLAREGVKLFLAAGIMPVIRPKVLIDQQNVLWDSYVKAAQDGGLDTPYIQIFNEPSDDREWKSGHVPQGYVDKWSSRWIDAAQTVLSAGGLPGVQCLDQDHELASLIAAVSAVGKADVWTRAWFAPHLYPLNHPPLHPYDDVNQQGTLVTQAEFNAHMWRGLFDEVNQHRAQDKNPGSTTQQIEESTLTYQNFENVFKRDVGFVPPMIVGEGGWFFQGSDDIRYPTIDEDLHAQYHASWYQWFSTRQNSRGEPLPDFLFAICPWLLYDFSGLWATAWINSTNGTRQKTIDAVTALPPFVRKFSWEA